MTKRSKLKKWVWSIFVIITIAAGGTGWYLYDLIYGPSVKVEDEGASLYVKTGSGMEEVLDSLASGDYVKDTGEFAWVARQMNYPNHVYPGKYRIQDGMSNHELIIMLRSGDAEPVRLTLNQFPDEGALARYVGKRLETDSGQIMDVLENDQRITGDWGFTEENLLTLFIPDTYQFRWNTSAEAFVERMYEEYQKFWNESRVNQAKEEGLKPQEVAILASIIQKESSQPAEWDTIAGVYLNRLDRGWPLESDPTVIYALKREKGMDSVSRVYKKYTKVESPYNTYQNRGLPPGPLLLPDKGAIKAVLNAPEHDYMFFVAKPDFSGYHLFSETLREHINKARKYHEALNERKIY